MFASVRACVCDENSHAIYAIVYVFLAVLFLLNPIRVALSQNIVMQIMHNVGVCCECCALCAVYSTFHGIITAN